MNIREVLVGLIKSKSNKSNLLTGLSIEQVGKSVYLFYKINKNDPKITFLARSIDGFEFNLVHKIQENYVSQKISFKIKNLIMSRLEYFDNGPIMIEGVINISRGKLVIYHHHEWLSGYQKDWAKAKLLIEIKGLFFF